MLIWAVFTLGYLSGVFFTLAVFLRRDEVDVTSYSSDSTVPSNSQNNNSWETFSQLIRPNYPKGTVLTPTVNISSNREDNNSPDLSPAS